jgi:O-antigen/teichoic acid export membrane protein
LGIIAKQGILNSIYSYLGVLLGFLTIIYVQPYFLKSTEIGLTRILVSFSFMASIIVPLGIGTVTMRFFPKIKNPDNGHNGYFFLIILFCVIGFILLSSVLLIFKNSILAYYEVKSPLFNQYFYFVFFFSFIVALTSVMNIYAASLYKTAISVFLNEVLVRVLQILVIFIYYFGYFNLNQFVIGFVSVYLIQLICLIIYIFKIDQPQLKINWSFYSTFFDNKVILFSVFMLFTAFASIGIKMIDQIIMGHYLSLDYIGIYATSIFMVAIMEVPYNSLEKISNTIAANSWANNDVANIKKIYFDSVRILMLVGGFLLCGLVCCANSIFALLPDEYLIGKSCMIIMAISSFINLSTGINSSIIATSHKYFVVSIFLFALIAVSIISNNLLIPKFGIVGAAYSALISMGMYNLLKVIYLWYRLKMLPYNKSSFVVLATIITVFLIVYFIPDFQNPYFTILVKGSIITILFTLATIKFHLADEIISKIPIIKNIRL